METVYLTNWYNNFESAIVTHSDSFEGPFSYLDWHFDEIPLHYVWLKEHNINYKSHFTNLTGESEGECVYLIEFENKEDAILFKLRWS